MKAIDFILRLRYYIRFFISTIKLPFARIFNDKCVFVLSTPRHGNMGDQAIVYAQYKFFESIDMKRNVIEFTETTYQVCKNIIPKFVKPEDLIVIDGGGNIGTLWIEAENVMRDIIKRFPKNRIFIMPQTAFFENSDYGNKVLHDSVEIYCAHPNLTVFCRDEVTFKLLREKFESVNTFYVPDMVMSLNNSKEKRLRKGAMVCFRTDHEKTCSDELKNDIIKYIEDKNFDVKIGSTIVERRVEPWQRNRLLKKKWNEFYESEFVITDRLHGMIFCAITNTPCLAIDNVSHKVRDGYKWLNHLPYILYCDSLENIYSQIDDLIALCGKNYCYDTAHIQEYINKMKEQF